MSPLGFLRDCYNIPARGARVVDHAEIRRFAGSQRVGPVARTSSHYNANRAIPIGYSTCKCKNVGRSIVQNTKDKLLSIVRSACICADSQCIGKSRKGIFVVRVGVQRERRGGASWPSDARRDVLIGQRLRVSSANKRPNRSRQRRSPSRASRDRYASAGIRRNYTGSARGASRPGRACGASNRRRRASWAGGACWSCH